MKTGSRIPHASVSWRAVATTAILPLALHGCRDRATTADVVHHCEALGVCDEAISAPVAEVILLDPGAGSPASRRTLEDVLAADLPELARRPGSVIELDLAGGGAATPTVLATAEVTRPARGTTRARTAHAVRFTTGTTAHFLQAAEPFMNGVRPVHIALAESIERIGARTVTPGVVRRLVVLSAGYEASDLGVFACHGEVPTPAVFNARLHRHQVLAENTLAGIDIGFAFFGPSPIPGRPACPVSLARTRAIQNVWQTALTHAGARAVVFSTSTVPFEASEAPTGSSTTGNNNHGNNSNDTTPTTSTTNPRGGLR